MNDKAPLLAALKTVFDRWQVLLGGLDEVQCAAPLTPSDWTVRDVIVHLWAWQQASVARAEAALHGRAPDYPAWWAICGPDPEEDVNRTNAWIHATYRDKPWPAAYADWQAQFRRYLDVLQVIPERDLLEPGKYAWMGGYPLSASLQGSCEHHEEHIEALLAWLLDHGKGG